MDHDIEIIGVGIATGREALALTFGVPVLDLRLALLDIQLAAGHVGKRQHVWVGLLEISGGCHHEEAGILVQQHLGALSQGSGHAKRRDLLPVCLPVGQLLPDFLHGALAAVTEPGGELGGAAFAQIAVLQLAVAQESDLTAADRTLLFFKQLSKESHRPHPLYFV